MPKKKAKERRKSADVKSAGASQLANSKSLSKSKKHSQPEEHHHFVHHRHHQSTHSEDGNSTLSNTPEPLSPSPSPPPEPLESEQIAGSGTEVEVVKLDVADQVAGPDSAEPLPLGSEFEIKNLGKTDSQMTDSFESASGRSLSSNSLASDVDISKGYSLGFETPIREEPDSIPMVESIADIKEELMNKTSSDNPLVIVKVSEAFIEELKKEGEKNEEKPAESASLEKVQEGENDDLVKSGGVEKEKEILPSEEESVVGATSAETDGNSGGSLGKEGCRKEDLQSTDPDGKSTLEKEGGEASTTDEKGVKGRSPSPPRFRYPCFWMGWWFSRCFDSDDD